MPVVSVSIRNTNYPIACDSGEEEKLQLAAHRLDKRVRALATNLPKTPQDIQLLLMTALMMEDEIFELKNAAREADSALYIDNAVSEAIDAVTDYIENLANTLEKA